MLQVWEGPSLGQVSIRSGPGDVGRRTLVSPASATAESPPSCCRSPHTPVCERRDIPPGKTCSPPYPRLILQVKIGGVP